MPRDARHAVFEFMLACIEGQYTDLGMARVTFYASLRNYTHWEDFSDMYRVLYKLCKEGRDISGFEKNVAKLLIHWINIAIQQQQQQHNKQDAAVPHLSDLLHLLTAIAKFNFALFEEDEVTQMIAATHKAFFSTHDVGDMGSCLDFADIVVRYRFVPFEALPLFLDMVSASVMLVPVELQKSKSWPIFQNLLRSHCAHSAILTLCRFLDKQPSKVDADNILIKGAITLLSEIAWGRSGSGAEVYMVSDSVILMYMRRAASKENDGINGTILQCLSGLVATADHTPSLMEWDAIWDIVDAITAYILKITDNNSNSDIKLFSVTESAASSSLQSVRHFAQFSNTIIRLYQSKQYKGPLTRFMQVLYQLRAYCCDNTASILLDYHVMEHSFLPSTEHWLKLLQEVTNTFYIHANPTTTTSALRLTMLDIVSDVCTSVKDFYSEVMYETIVIPMMQTLPSETDASIRQLAIDLLVSSLSDCQNEAIFDKLIQILRDCAQCHCHGAFVADAFFSGGSCMGVPAMCGLSDIFQNLLMASNGKLCSKTFNIITEIANDRSDLSCPYGGPKIVALDLLLRFRCPTNHHIYLIEDNVQEEENSVIAAIRLQQQKKRQEAEKNKASQMFMPGSIVSNKAQQQQRQEQHAPTRAVFHPSPHVFSYNESPQSESEAVLDINEMLKSYVRVLSHSPNWVVVLFVLKRLSQQLSNKHLFCGASPYINKLRRRLVKWTSTRKFLEQLTNLPPHIKRNDLNVYAYSLLTVLISYRRIFTEPKQDQDEIVYAFYVGIMQVTSATRLCINSLAVCCHEMPLSVAKMLNEILQRMSQIISVSSVSVHILEFLSALARLPNLYANFTGDMYKPVFAIALNYLQHSHSQQQQQQPSPISTPSASPMIPGQASGPKEASQGALKQYVLIMAYLVITVWFTAIPLRERRKHVPFIIQRLLSGISMGKSIDEQTYTCIDMLSRFTFAEVSLAPQKSIVSKILMGDGDTVSAPSVKQSQRTWVYGHTLLTLRTAKSLGWVEVTIRRPSGTVSMMCYVENKIKSEDIDYRTLPALLMMQYQPDLMASKIMKEELLAIEEEDERVGRQAIDAAVREVLSDPKPDNESTAAAASNPVMQLRKTEPSIDPGFLYLQFNNYPDIARAIDVSPPLPDDEATARTLATFDRIPVVDFHKIGVLYVGKGQTHELEILANTYGSPDYVRFLNALGTIQRLHGLSGNTGGLDREMDIDGRYAYFWKDDVTEAVFHAATMMPTNLERDPQCSAKKRHIGNDYVSIVYNDSGMDYAFDTLPSQFNFINIVVSPHSISTEAVSPTHALIGAENSFFRVEMQRRPDMPDIGPLSEPKLVSAQSLPGFVRQAAIHANIFAQVFWQSAGAGGKREYVSHWRERLKQIQRVKERLAGKSASTTPATPNLDHNSGKTSKDGYPYEALLDFTKYT
ncbi:hypothetical protein FB192DRAFT_1317196 [Mucor lusitanicus]|uniref:Rap-GAP domain-containing protein n=2 Tax=Mucor circinelloides f. lusitanicus TaxID=29924 RepID=A0A8H4BRQ9_MUCCL|nr:hypothetical protein FB192DRAFT_1317196 [Mucor lusitanicus]